MRPSIDTFLNSPPTDKKLRRSYFARALFKIPGFREKNALALRKVRAAAQSRAARDKRSKSCESSWRNEHIRKKRIAAMRRPKPSPRYRAAWTPERRLAHANKVRQAWARKVAA